MSRIEQEQESEDELSLQTTERLMKELNINSDIMLEIAYTYERENKQESQIVVFDKIEIKISQAIKGYYKMYKYDQQGRKTMSIKPDWQIEKMIATHLGRPDVRITFHKIQNF